MLSPSNTILLVAMGLLLVLSHTSWPKAIWWRIQYVWDLLYARWEVGAADRKMDRMLANELDHYCACCEEGLRYMRETGSHAMDHPGDCTYDPRGKCRGSDDDYYPEE